MTKKRILYFIFPLSLLLCLVGCDKQSARTETGIEMINPIIRAPLPGKTVTVAYMDLLNHNHMECHLTGGKAPFAKTIEVHQHTHKNGVMQMRKLDVLSIKPGIRLALAPGGYHLMILGLNAPLTPGQEYPLTLQFSDCPPVTGRAMVKSVME